MSKLWIRSQNGEIFTKCENLYISPKFANKFSIAYGTIELGNYCSKKRCIEIIDEIQSLVQKGNAFIVGISNDLDKESYDELHQELESHNFGILCNYKDSQFFPLNQDVIYTMPKEQMKLIGKLLIAIGLLGTIFSVVYQVYLNFTQFGTWYSGYIIIHWSMIGFLGIIFLRIGLKIIEKLYKIRNCRQKEEKSANGELKDINK